MIESIDPSAENLEQKMDDISTKLRRNNDEGMAQKKILLYVYYSGHGTFTDSTGILVNEFSEENSIFPLEQRLFELSKLPNTYVAVVFDCSRIKMPSKNNLRLTHQYSSSERPANIYATYGSLPTSGVA